MDTIPRHLWIHIGTKEAQETLLLEAKTHGCNYQVILISKWKILEFTEAIKMPPRVISAIMSRAIAALEAGMDLADGKIRQELLARVRVQKLLEREKQYNDPVRVQIRAEKVKSKAEEIKRAGVGHFADRNEKDFYARGHRLGGSFGQKQ